MASQTNGHDDTQDAARAETGTILPFRPRSSASLERPDTPDMPPPASTDDFRHRMLVNAAGLACAAILTASGIWLASSIANLRTTQDCVLSGRRNCAPIPAVDRQSSVLRQH